MLTMRGRAVCDPQTVIAADVATMSALIMVQRKGDSRAGLRTPSVVHFQHVNRVSRCQPAVARSTKAARFAISLTYDEDAVREVRVFRPACSVDCVARVHFRFVRVATRIDAPVHGLRG
jgi:hypothetical protein